MTDNSLIEALKLACDDMESARCEKTASALKRLEAGDATGALAILDRVVAADTPESALAWLARAAANLQTGAIDAARGDYVRAIEEPSSVPAALWPLLVVGFMDTEPGAEAIAALTDALDEEAEARPEEAAIFVARGHSYWKRGLLENAVSEFVYAVELDEEVQEAWLAASECLLELGRPAEAAHALDQAADLDPNEIALFAHLGDAWLAAGEPARAISAYEEGIELEQREPALYRGRARASLELNLFEDVEEDVRTIFRLSPDEVKAGDWWLLASALYGQARDTEVVEALDECAELAEPTADLYRLRGDVYFALGDWEGARRDYRLALELRPDDTEAQLSLAEVHLELGEHGEAAAAAESVIESFPGEVDAYVIAARARGSLGEPPAAAEALDRAIEQNARVPEVYVERATLRMEAAHPYLAWRDLRWALDLDPQYAYAYVVRAQLALEIEGPEEALADLDAALDVDAGYGPAYAWRGRALQLAGRFNDALSDWEEADSLLPADHPLLDRIAEWRDEGSRGGG